MSYSVSPSRVMSAFFRASVVRGDLFVREPEETLIFGAFRLDVVDLHLALFVFLLLIETKIRTVLVQRQLATECASVHLIGPAGDRRAQECPAHLALLLQSLRVQVQ